MMKRECIRALIEMLVLVVIMKVYQQAKFQGLAKYG